MNRVIIAVLIGVPLRPVLFRHLPTHFDVVARRHLRQRDEPALRYERQMNHPTHALDCMNARKSKPLWNPYVVGAGVLVAIGVVFWPLERHHAIATEAAR